MLRTLGGAHQVVHLAALPNQHNGIERLETAKVSHAQIGCLVRDPHAVAVELDARVVAFVLHARSDADRDAPDATCGQLAPAVEALPRAPCLLAGNHHPAMPCRLRPDGILPQNGTQRIAVDNGLPAIPVTNVHDHVAQRDSGQEVDGSHALERFNHLPGFVAETVETGDTDDTAGVLDARHFIGQQVGRAIRVLVAPREEALLPRTQQIAVCTDARVRSIGGEVGGKDGMTASGIARPRTPRVEHVAQVGCGKGGEVANARGAAAHLLVGIAFRKHTLDTIAIQANPVVATKEDAHAPTLQHGRNALNRVLLTHSRSRSPFPAGRFKRRAVGINTGQVGQRTLADGEPDLSALPFDLTRGVEAVLQELAHDGFGLAIPLSHGQRGEALRRSRLGEEQNSVHLSRCSHKRPRQ